MKFSSLNHKYSLMLTTKECIEATECIAHACYGIQPASVDGNED